MRPHREGPTIVGGVSEVILTVLYDKRKRVTFWVTLLQFKDMKILKVPLFPSEEVEAGCREEIPEIRD